MKSLKWFLRDYLDRKALAGGYSWNTRKIASYVELTTYMLTLLPIITYIITKSPVLSLIMVAAPLMPMLTTMVWAAYSVDSVRDNVDWELPFFIVLLDLIHDIGGDITHAFEISARVGLRWMGREWTIVNRYAMTTNSITKALQLRARIHPSLEFQRFVNGYVSVWGYSGDVTSYVRSVENMYLSSLSSRLSSLSKQIIDVVLAVVSSIVVMVLFIIITTILGMNYAALYLIPAMALLIPALILRVHLSIPYIIRMDIKHDRNIYLITAVSAILSLFAVIYLGAKGVIFLALPPLVFSLLVSRRVNDIRNSILSLPDLIRDISEIVKAGIGVNAALERVLDNPYPEPLITYLRKITQINDSRVDGPWLIKYAMNVLKEISSLGSPSKALDKLAEVFLNLKALFIGINYSARSLQVLNFSLPFIFAGMVYISRFVVSVLSSVIKNAPYTLVGLVMPSMNILLLPLIITAYIVSMSVAILSSLLSNLTLSPTVRLMVPIPLTLALMLMAMEIPVPA